MEVFEFKLVGGVELDGLGIGPPAPWLDLGPPGPGGSGMVGRFRLGLLEADAAELVVTGGVWALFLLLAARPRPFLLALVVGGAGGSGAGGWAGPPAGPPGPPIIGPLPIPGGVGPPGYIPILGFMP